MNDYELIKIATGRYFVKVEAGIIKTHEIIGGSGVWFILSGGKQSPRYQSKKLAVKSIMEELGL